MTFQRSMPKTAFPSLKPTVNKNDRSYKVFCGLWHSRRAVIFFALCTTVCFIIASLIILMEQRHPEKHCSQGGDAEGEKWHIFWLSTMQITLGVAIALNLSIIPVVKLKLATLLIPTVIFKILIMVIICYGSVRTHDFEQTHLHNVKPIVLIDIALIFSFSMDLCQIYVIQVCHLYLKDMNSHSGTVFHVSEQDYWSHDIRKDPYLLENFIQYLRNRFPMREPSIRVRSSSQRTLRSQSSCPSGVFGQ